MVIRNDDGTEENIRFANVELNHNFYDSLAKTAKISFLEPQLQQEIQTVYRKIKRHNKHLDIVNRISSFGLDGSLRTEKKKQTERYLKWMNDAERQLEEDISVILKELKRQF